MTYIPQHIHFASVVPTFREEVDNLLEEYIIAEAERDAGRIDDAGLEKRRDAVRTRLLELITGVKLVSVPLAPEDFNNILLMDCGDGVFVDPLNECP